jgi:hypothetical protein
MTCRRCGVTSGRSCVLKEVAGRLVECLAPLPHDELETLGRVHWIARDLYMGGRSVTMAGNERALAGTAERKGKLSPSNFTGPNLRQALRFLRGQRLVSPEY